MRKKAVTLLLAMSMIVASLGGCGGKSDVSTSEKAPASGTETTAGTQAAEAAGSEAGAENGNFNAEGYPIVNDDLTLDVMMQITNSSSLTDPEDMPALTRLEELTGIHANYEFIRQDDWSTKLNLRLSTGDYPDVIMSIRGTVDAEEYGVVQKVLLPLDDLVDQYMPNYKALLEMQEEFSPESLATLMSSDGQRYTLAFRWGADYDANSVFFINQTWLDALGLETPTNVEELTEVLRAFKTGDPNGNGEADEIPMTGTLKNGSIKYMMYLFGVPYSDTRYLYIDDDRKVQPVVTQEGFRECMEWLHTCYDEGLLDPEAISQDANTVSAKLNEGNAGFFTEYRLTAMGFDGIADDAVLWVPDKNAKVYKLLNQVAKCVYIPVTNENIPATMRWLDAWLDKETMASIYYGEPGSENGGWFYNEDGKIESNPNTVASDGATQNYLGNNAFVFAAWPFFEENYALEYRVEEKKGYDATYASEGLFQKYSNDWLKQIKFTGDEKTRRDMLLTDISTAGEEWVATFVTEGVTDESWNEFQELLKDIGIDEYVEMHQAGIDALDF